MDVEACSCQSLSLTLEIMTESSTMGVKLTYRPNLLLGGFHWYRKEGMRCKSDIVMKKLELGLIPLDEYNDRSLYLNRGRAYPVMRIFEEG